MANDLVISVGANIQQLERQMKAASKIAAQEADRIEKEFSRRNPTLNITAGILTGGIAGVAAAFAGNIDRIGASFFAANKEIASFAETARRAGIEVQRFQELRYAAGSMGIGGKEFDAGLSGLAKSLNEARSAENDLTKLLDANGIKYKDRKGEVISTNEALSLAADLISRAATEQDKIEIAKRLSIPADFVPLLEGGAEALNKLAKNAADSGTILSSDVIAKAKQFDAAWDSGWNSFATYSKAAVAQAGGALNSLITQAREFQASMQNARSAGEKVGTLLKDLSQGAQVVTAPLPPSRPEGTPTTAPMPPSRPSGLTVGKPTVIPNNAGGSKGGGGGKSDEETRTAQVDRYIESLMRANRVLEAEAATIGKSKAERAAAIELARIGTVADETQRAKLEELVAANEKLRAGIESVANAQKGLNDAQKFFGEAASDALEDMIFNGAKAEDVIKNLTKSLAQAALKAAFLGTGPLGAISGIPHQRILS